ncbi:MAG: hypothetical protein GXY95_07485 [Clostridiales bacterium]|jgi:NRPS condensation-like uncharacterized protein|nr:hypothetical protein [Clostridiales bacterium]
MAEKEQKENHGGKFWIKLDNAGKVFPGQNTQTWSNIFRGAITLKEKVDPAVLEEALARVLPRFPCFDVNIKRGFFWYYFEKAKYPAPPVMPDVGNPCHRIKFRENKGFLFRVYYHERRIAVEFFHALTDGYGGSLFLCTLTAEYLRIKYGANIPPGGAVLSLQETADEFELEDSFERFASSKVRAKRRDRFVYHKKGERLPAHMVNVTTGYMPVDKLLELARANNASITEYLAAILMYIHYNIQKEEERKQKDVSVQIPVNLRRTFPSKTLRNFSLCYSVRINPNMGEYTFEEILKHISLYLRFINNEKTLNSMMTANMALERNPFMRALPLPVKWLAIAISFGLTAEKTTTAMITNLGPVKVPDEMLEYVESYVMMPSPGKLNGARVGAASIGNTFAATFANIYTDSRIEREFFTFLVKKGIPVKIESNRESIPENFKNNPYAFNPQITK